MKPNGSIDPCQERIRQLETQVRHLQNELRLTKAEYEGLISEYFDIFSNMEKMVEKRTDELEQLKSQLEIKNQELQVMLDASPALIFFQDKTGRYLRVNRKFADVLNLPVQEIVGKSHGELFPESPGPFFREDAPSSGESGGALQRYTYVDTPLGRKPMLTENVPYQGSNGEMIGSIGFAMDMTEYEQIQKEKQELQEKLARSQKMESLGLLAGGVAHDLNNVLTGTVSYPELLLMELPDDSPLREPIRIIQQSGQKAAAIVQDLLTLARRGVTNTRILNLNDIVTGYLRSPEHQTLAKEYRKVTVRPYLGKELLDIRGSEVHLRKTVMNLMANAFEAQPSGGEIHIVTFNRYIDTPLKGYDDIREGDYVVLEVRDTGIGIAPADLERIFEPFYTKKIMGRSGTGLGMAVVWGTMQDHNGYINVESVEGQGTKFSLFFPITREKRSLEKAPVPLEEYTGNGERILVVDDIAEQREIAASILGKLRYQVTTVASGEEAVDHVRRHPVDLVVLDMIMEPGMDGLNTFKELLKVNPNQRAIIASGFSETDRVRKAQRLGAGAYVKKPYLLENIGLAVRRELDRKK